MHLSAIVEADYMAKKKSGKKPIEQYDHRGKERVNNPPVGLVTSATDKETGKKTYAYDPLSRR